MATLIFYQRILYSRGWAVCHSTFMISTGPFQRSLAPPRLFSWAVWHSCRMGARNQEQTRGRIGPQLRLGNLRVGELHFCPLCTALDQASSLSRKLAYVPGPTFGFVKLLASSGSHCTKWADEQHRQAGFEFRLVPDLPLPFIPTLIGLRAFDLVSSRVWWEAATNIWHALSERSFVSCGGALSTGCDCVLHGSVGCVPPLDTSPLASGGRPPRL